MGWFTRLKKGIITETKDKKDIREGLWYKCPRCKKIVTAEDHYNNANVCGSCNYHDKTNSEHYFELLFDESGFTTLFDNLYPADPLQFVDTKKYADRVKATAKSTGINEAMSVATGTIDGINLVVASMNFEFIGGSMGAVVGEKISRAIDHAIATKSALLIISKSGGARMMEAGFSLMQMAKTSAKLTLLADARLPYISLMTDPTTGGVTASYAMLGDLNIAEPEALIGFAGPRVIKETIKRDLPEGFQRSEFLLEHGFIDFIVDRRELKSKLAQQLRFLMGS